MGFTGGVGCAGSRRGKTPVQRGEVQLVLPGCNAVAVGGMCGVAGKCIDITQNTDCEGI